MKNCSLFLIQDDIENIANSIITAFSQSKVEVKGQKSDWAQIKVSQKTGWFGQSTITFSLQSYKQVSNFEYFINGMTNLMAQFIAQDSEVHKKLLVQIQNTKVSISIFADSGFDLFTDSIFQVAKEFNAYVLVDALNWLDADKNVLLDMSRKFNDVETETTIETADNSKKEETQPTENLPTKKVLSY